MRQRPTNILVFLVPALVAFYLGTLAHDRALVDLDTVAAMGNAWRVFHWQDSANMALIGFDQPPAMALLFVPFGAFAPQSLVSGVAAPIVGAIFLGLSVLIIWRLSRSLGLPWWVALILSAGFTLHPLVLSYAMVGGKGIVLTFVLLGLAASLISWQREQRVRDVLTGSFFAAAAVLLAYETVIVVLAAALYLVACCRREQDRPPAKAEGLLIAFLLPVGYVALVWIGANWAIMGSPWHFWPRGATALTGDVSGALSVAVAIGLAASPLLLALLYHGLRRQYAGFAAPAVWLLLASLLAAFVFPHGEAGGAGRYPWPELVAVAASALGAGAALLVALLAQLWSAGRDGSLRRVLSPGLVIVAVGSLAVAYMQQAQHHVLPVGVRTVLGGRPAFATSVGDEWAAGDRLCGCLTPNLRHVIAGPTAYVVALRAGARQNVFVSPYGMAQPNQPHGDLGPGSLVVIGSAFSDDWLSWQNWKPEDALAVRWGVGPPNRQHPLWSWTCYQFIPRSSGQRGLRAQEGAIIAPGTPHANPRR